MSISSINSGIASYTNAVSQAPKSSVVTERDAVVRAADKPLDDSLDFSKSASRAYERRKEELGYYPVTGFAYELHLEDRYYLGNMTPEDVKQEFLDFVNKQQELREGGYTGTHYYERGNELKSGSDARRLTDIYVDFRCALFIAAKRATGLEASYQAKANNESEFGFAYNADHYYKSYDALALVDEVMRELGASGRYAGARIPHESDVGNPTYAGYNPRVDAYTPIEYRLNPVLKDPNFVPPRGFKLRFANKKYPPEAWYNRTQYAFSFASGDPRGGGHTHYINLPRGMSLFRKGHEILNLEKYRTFHPELQQYKNPRNTRVYDLSSFIKVPPGAATHKIAEEFIRANFTNVEEGIVRVTVGGRTITADVPFWFGDQDSTRLKFEATELIQADEATMDVLKNFSFAHYKYDGTGR